MAVLMQTKWWGLCTPARRQNNGLRKIFPGYMTVAACAKWPMNDSSSLHVHECLLLHSSTGMPALANTSMAIVAADAASKVPGAPNRRKSSR